MIPPGKNPRKPLPPLSTVLFGEVRQLERLHNEQLNEHGVPYEIRLLTTIQWEINRIEQEFGSDALKEMPHLFKLEEWLKRYKTEQFVHFGEIARAEWRRMLKENDEPTGPPEKFWSEQEIIEAVRQQDLVDAAFLEDLNNA